MATKPWYFEYQDYTILKKIFDYKSTENFDVSSANDLIKLIQNTPTKEKKLRETFCKLKKFIQRDDCFYKHDNNKCCNYINYWLNITVRDSEYNVNDKKFYIFDKFMQVDPNIKNGATKCTSRLSYMNKDELEKMEKLYNLYDDFTELKQRDNPSSLCQNISVLAEKYKSMKQEYKEDHKLCEVLKKLKKVIETDNLVVKNICETNTSNLFYLKIDPPREEQKTVAARAHRGISGEALPPKNASVTSPQVHGRPPVETRPLNPVSVSLPQAHGRPPGETHTRPLITVPSSSAHDRNSVQTPTPTPVSVSLSQAKGLEKQAGGESERTPSVPLARLPLELPALPLLVPPLEPSDPSETDVYANPKGPYRISEQASELQQGRLQEHGSRFPPEEPEEPQEQDEHYFSEDEEVTSLEKGDPSTDSIFSTFDTEKIMETIKGAVSDVLESVEPVPVLCVSGGMGALYLLFKVSKIALKLFKLHFYNYNTYK
ncbi:hypothetical protein PVNG_06348 [Plasmodium vivax North Korean]|uniref:VIR protein n=1 Tax=Plasmodium vivax North Korean TaxID=1035514 RepID=A0A0J9TKC5_PLAVI|nr:hypothetical protein PVNG_06348 [Plasmodium vivax North Korean]